MLGAGLLARKAVERGLAVPPRQDQPRPRLQGRHPLPGKRRPRPYLEALGFHVVGYGCTTCIGNSGPLPDPVAAAVARATSSPPPSSAATATSRAASTPSPRPTTSPRPPSSSPTPSPDRRHRPGNRAPRQRTPTASPSTCATSGPPGRGNPRRRPPPPRPELYRKIYTEYVRRLQPDEWNRIAVPDGPVYRLGPTPPTSRSRPSSSTCETPEAPRAPHPGARVLACSATRSPPTTSRPPAPSPSTARPAATSSQNGVNRKRFNSYGSRRGNHEVMMRGTFANIRLRTCWSPASRAASPSTCPPKSEMDIYDAAMRYAGSRGPPHRHRRQGIRHRQLARLGRQGYQLLGVRAVIAESFERIHRSNLVGMGVLPLQFLPGESAAASASPAATAAPGKISC
jgi:aconitate hydratase